MTARRDGHLVLWSNWIAHRPLTADVAGSNPVRTTKTIGPEADLVQALG